MKPFFTSLALLISLSLSLAQTRETLDLMTYSPPVGWKKETADFGVSFSNTDQITRSWCRVTIYKSINSSGSPTTDFTSEWGTLVTKFYPDAILPQPQTKTEDGWIISTGVSKFTFNNEQAAVTLITITGYGKEMSLMVLMNTDKFLTQVDSFIESMDVQKPQQNPQTTTAASNNQLTKSALTLAVASQPLGGIAMPMTNFDDGWVAQAFTDFVKVTKGNITVFLHYGIALNDELRNGNMELNLFNRQVLPRYNVNSVHQMEKEQFCYYCVYFFEADVTEKSTGQRFYLGFRVLTENGISRCIEILSPSSDAFKTEFPNQEKVASMLGYNKFAITLADVAGKWQGGSGSAMNMYYTSTGNYAGMSAVAMADEFTFNKDGTYTSHHSGASGMVGSMKTYDQKYAGKVTVANWSLTATNRWEGKTDDFNASFEAIPDGWMLHLQDKKYSGLTYDLVRKR